MKHSILLAAVPWLIMAAAPGAAIAQKMPQPWYTYQPIPLGGRTATMGGAGAAFGHDSAMPLLNPAGLALIDQHNISLSATVYSLHAIDVESFYSTGERSGAFNDPSVKIPTDTMHSQTVDVFPTSFVYSWPFGAGVGEPWHHVISLSILTPRRYSIDYVGRFGLDIAGTRMEDQFARSISNTGYYAGPSYALQITPWLRAGVATMLLYNTYFMTQPWTGHTFYGTDSQRSVNNLTTDGTMLAFVPVAGLQFGPFSGFSIGFSLQGESLPLTGHVTQDAAIEQNSSEGIVLDRIAEGTSVVTTARLESDDYRVLTPTRLTLGLGYEKPGGWAVALDAHYYMPISYNLASGKLRMSTYVSGKGTTIAEEEIVNSVYGDGVFNVNLGFEVFVTRSVALRFGGFTDFSPTPELVASTDPGHLLGRKISMFGGTAGVGFFFGPVDFTVGMAYTGGVGDFGALRNLLGNGNQSSQEYQVASATESRLMGFITGGVSFGEAFAPVTKHAKELEAVIAPPVPAAPSRQEPPPAPAPQPMPQPVPQPVLQPVLQPVPQPAPQPIPQSAPQYQPIKPPVLPPQPAPQPGIYQYPSAPPQATPAQPAPQPPASQPQQYQPVYYPPGYYPPPQQPQYYPPPQGYYPPPQGYAPQPGQPAALPPPAVPPQPAPPVPPAP